MAKLKDLVAAKSTHNLGRTKEDQLHTEAQMCALCVYLGVSVHQTMTSLLKSPALSGARQWGNADSAELLALFPAANQPIGRTELQECRSSLLVIKILFSRTVEYWNIPISNCKEQ